MINYLGTGFTRLFGFTGADLQNSQRKPQKLTNLFPNIIIGHDLELMTAEEMASALKIPLADAKGIKSDLASRLPKTDIDVSKL